MSDAITDHTPAGWRTESVSDACRVVTGQGRSKIILARLCPPQLPERVTAANAQLMSIAPTAPHSCSDPNCPGDLNRRRLERLDFAVEVLTEIALLTNANSRQMSERDIRYVYDLADNWLDRYHRLESQEEKADQTE